MMTSENTINTEAPLHPLTDAAPAPPMPDSSEHRVSNPSVMQDPIIAAEEPQLFARLLQIAAATEQTQSDISAILEEIRHSGVQIDVLTRHFTNPETMVALETRLAELISRQETSEEQLAELNKTINRLGRTQFKTNALTETKERQTAEAIDTLQEIVTRRQQAQNEQTWQDQRFLAKMKSDARGELAAELLPTLDGLGSVLQNGYALLARQQEQEKIRAARTATRSANPTLGQRLRRFFLGEPPPANAPAEQAPSAETSTALIAWLEGLQLVQERFLKLLAAENIQPIDAQNQVFDPRLHVAVAAVSRDDVPSGTVVSVEREGYRQNERVLRFAEVSVARASDTDDRDSENQTF